jgi:translation initiation factor 2 alpha subunit (eIF-2alpha)
LLEYNNREALILASSVTRKRIKNVKKLLRVGTQDCMQVITIDKSGGFIDLSKRTVQI